MAHERKKVLQSLSAMNEEFASEGTGVAQPNAFMEAEVEKLKTGDRSDKPEDSIPDLPENQAAREFLKNAPSKGLFLPMGVEVKIMKCWRCKAFGHRTGDRECPMAQSGNLLLDAERQAREDPMAGYVGTQVDTKEQSQMRVKDLQALMANIRNEQKEKKAAKKQHKKKDKKKKDKKKKDKKKKDKKKRKRAQSDSSTSSSSSDDSQEEAKDSKRRKLS
jgi:retinitis pigmentosa 9 protein